MIRTPSHPRSKSLRLFAALLAFWAAPHVAAQVQSEASSPTPVVSPSQFPGDFEEWSFYNPAAIEHNGQLILLVQSGQPQDPPNSPWTFCPLDQVVAFKSAWTYEGVRSVPTLDDRISPCDCPPPPTQCPPEDLHYYGLGSALKSNHDGKLYVLLEQWGAEAVAEDGDLEAILLGESTDGSTWTYPASVNPLIVPSTVGADEIFVLDPILIADEEQWWGFFQWGVVGEPGGSTGRIRIIPDETSPRGLRVEILADDDTYKVVADDGSFDFTPRTVFFEKVNSIVPENDGSFTAWSWTQVNTNPASQPPGCEDGIDTAGSRLVTRSVTATTHDSERLEMPARYRANPSRNLGAHALPLAIRGPEDRHLLFSSSADTACETVPGWPPMNPGGGSNVFVGMEVVRTELSAYLIDDAFHNTSDRAGDCTVITDCRLDDTPTEIGETIWQAEDDVFILNDLATDDGEPGNHFAFLPFDTTPMFPDEDLWEVSAMVNPTGAEWVGIGWASAVGGIFSTGSLWMNVRDLGGNQASWSVLVNGTSQTIASGTSDNYVSGQANEISLAYGSSDETIVVTLNGDQVLADVLQGVSPNPFSFVGFHFFDPNGVAGATSLDDFRLRPTSSALYRDGFESGDTSAWQ